MDGEWRKPDQPWTQAGLRRATCVSLLGAALDLVGEQGQKKVFGIEATFARHPKTLGKDRKQSAKPQLLHRATEVGGNFMRHRALHGHRETF